MSLAPIPASICPSCGARLDDFTAIDFDGSVPSEGDVSVCCHCQNISVYRADQTLRPMTPREWVAMKPEDRRKLEVAKLALDRIGVPPA
jgi:hypothetical protein